MVVGFLNNHVVDLLRLVLENVEKVFANDERYDSKLLMISAGNIERPKFNITREMLITYLETGFSQRDIAKLLTVNERRIQRRINEYKLDEEIQNILTLAILS